MYIYFKITIFDLLKYVLQAFYLEYLMNSD